MNLGYALLGIVLVATIYEINSSAGLAIGAIVILAMIYTIYSKRVVSWEVTLPMVK